MAHSYILWRYGCIICWALRCLVCDAVIVMSSAYVVICASFGRNGMSEVYMLNNVGDRTPPFDTPVLIFLSFESVPLY